MCFFSLKFSGDHQQGPTTDSEHSFNGIIGENHFSHHLPEKKEQKKSHE